MPESRFGLCESFKGGLTGDVIGLSAVGLPVLPLSSVAPAPLTAPEPDRVASDPDSVICEVVLLEDGWEVVGKSFMEKRDLCGDVSGRGADCRVRVPGE